MGMPQMRQAGQDGSLSRLSERANLLGETALMPGGQVNDALVDHTVDYRVAAARAEAASSCLPAFNARVALRMALRSCEVSASLRARCTVDCSRAAFSADFVFAKRTPYQVCPNRTLKEPRSLLLIGSALVNPSTKRFLISLL